MSHLYESYNDLFSLLPVKIYKHNLKGNFIYAPLHWHRSLEITITLTGHIRFTTASNNFDCAESDWLIVNSCELHSSRCINPSDIFLGISMIISLPFIEKWLGKNLNIQVMKAMNVLYLDIDYKVEFDIDTDEDQIYIAKLYFETFIKVNMINDYALFVLIPENVVEVDNMYKCGAHIFIYLSRNVSKNEKNFWRKKSVWKMDRF